MSTWNMYSDGGGKLRWEQSDSIPQIKPNFDIPNSSGFRLPSMNDLLLQGCLNVKENRNGRTNNSTIFKTGLGKPVLLNQSSISRAVSVIGQHAEDGCSNLNDNCNEGAKHSTMFCTGLGKPVAVNQSSGSRAALLLGEDTAVISSGKEHAIDKGCGFLDSLFQTGSGKRVNISSDGLLRAKTLLGFDDDTINFGIQNVQHSKGVHNTNDTYERKCSPYLTGVRNYETVDTLCHPRPSSLYNISSIGRTNVAKNDSEINTFQPERYNSAHKQAPIKFHTAGGRSIFVSNDALLRARSLLGEPDLGCFLNDRDGGNSVFAFSDDRQSEISASGKRNDTNNPLFHHLTPEGKYKTRSFSFPSPSCNQTELSTKFKGICAGNNLIKKFDAVGNDSECGQESSITFQCSPLNDRKNLLDINLYHNPSSGLSSRTPLADVSNTRNIHVNTGQPAIEKRRPRNHITVSPFKRPRRTNFSTPLKRDVAVFPSGLSKLSSDSSGCKRKVSSRYPFHHQRMSMREFFGVPPLEKEMLEHFPDQIRQMTSADAQKHIFNDGCGINGMGAEALFQALPQYGASASFASKEWVANHYKWIVWKLALYEQCYPARSAGKFLTVSNVLEELRYRYEREVNHGHRSAIKRILEGDAPPSSMMILSISAIHSDCGLETGTSSEALTGALSTGAVKVELTDKWYSITAVLDVPLSKQLAAGRFSVGQKLRIWGARLSGWNGPVSPLEVTSVCLLLHMNGTYRAHWAERLGFCKNPGPPLAFRCIKINGGLVPQTLVGITRVYPILYKERLSCGASVVRSERLENKMMELYNQRRSAVVEGIVSEFQKERNDSHNYDSDSEGAKIYQMLETTEEPEFLMADMSPEQLMTFSAYKSKLEVKRRSEMEKSIEKALQDAGLRNRDVTPFMRVRVVGLTRKNCQGKSQQKEGIITIWNPTEKQKEELVEGKVYAIAGLTPSGSDSDILHLKARGSYAKWLPLSSNASKQFIEFDIAAFVVHVGDVYTCGQQKKQWVFVTDGSVSRLQSYDLLAISFCSPSKDCDSFEPINYNLVGSTVGFCNLIKKAQDQKNYTWVAEASEISTYYLNFDSPQSSHLTDAATSTRRWANISTLIVNKTREKVLSIFSD